MSFCTPALKEELSQDQEQKPKGQGFSVNVRSINAQTLVMNIFPPEKMLDQTFYVSLSMDSCGKKMKSPDIMPTNEEKNRAKMLMFIIQEKQLSLLFYKDSVYEDKEGNKITESPFDTEYVVTTRSNKPIGTSPKGIGGMIMNNSGDGVQAAALGSPVVYDPLKGFEVVIHFDNDEKNKWQFLIGAVRINLINPGLNDPYQFSTC